MSAVEVTISGVLYDRMNRTAQNVVLIGEATLTGLGVGGGPVLPPDGGKPPSVWPSPGRPAHPIELPPEGEIPPKPDEPPPDGESKPPPEDGGWGYWADEVNSWVYKPATDEAQPKATDRRRR